MSKVLTEADAFTATVTVPEGGDARTAESVEAPLQALANRTNALMRRGRNAAYNVASSDLAAGGNYTLTTQVASTGFSHAANAVTVPAPGRYLVMVSALVTDTDTNDPTIVFIGLYLGGNIITAGIGSRPSGTNSQDIPVHLTTLLEIADPATEKIELRNGVNAGATIGADKGSMIIVRLSEL